jgi:hypothetical protein
MKLINLYQGIAIALTASLVTPTTTFAAVFSSAGNIAGEVNAFRAALGEPNNLNALGPLPAGRREINWDAGIVPFDMPPDFFNTTVPRGAEFSTAKGSEFRVSNPIATDVTAPPGGDNEFSSINPTYPDQFVTFSPFRLFTPFDTNVLDVNFFIPGSKTPATVSGFGAIFTDVDLPDSSKLDFFDINNNLLLSQFVPTAPQGLSFLGATFDTNSLFRVRITSGNTPIGPNDDPAKGVDIVVMDDFLYGEPQAVGVVGVPEPSSVLGLLFGGILPLVSWTKRRRCKSAT